MLRRIILRPLRINHCSQNVSKGRCVSTTCQPYYKEENQSKEQSVSTDETTDKAAFVKQDNADIVISGGGMVGFALACALGQSRRIENKKIVLLESASPKIFELKDEYSNRVCALNPRTVNLLKSLGAWQHITSMRFKPVKKMQVWDACADAVITFGDDDLTRDVAYIVENDVILESLNRVLQSLSTRIDVRNNTRIKSYKLPTNKSRVAGDLQEHDAVVQLENDTEISAKLIVGADGYNSLLRNTMGVRYVHWGYDQMAIVATLKLAETSDNVTAWQRFLPTGPIALLPLTDTLSSLVWTTDTHSTKLLMQLAPESFVDALNHALWSEEYKDRWSENLTLRFSRLLRSLAPSTSPCILQLPPSVAAVLGNRGAFPLGMGHAVQYVSPRAVLIGDAAHRVHPLAGQGVNLGFGDVEDLVKTIEGAVANGADIGSLSYLMEYETIRQRHNIPIMMAVDGLQKLYGTKSSPVVALRSIGLELVNSLRPLKNYFMKQASL